MDHQLLSLPPWLDEVSGRYWLSISSWNEGWQCGYVGADGALPGFSEQGNTPTEALDKLKESVRILRLLEAPSGEVEKA